MARYSDQLIEQIKQDISLLQLIQDQGHTPKRQGKDYVLACPFHDDRTPSCLITPEKNLWNCLGACQRGGSVIDWVMKTDRLDFRQAVEQLSQRLPGGRVQNEPVNPDYLQATDDDQTLLNQVFDHYAQTLKTHPAGLAYLEQRGLKDPALIEQFQLGVADQSLMRRCRTRDSQAGNAVRDQLKRLGLVRSSGHEFFKGSLVVPIRDADSNICQAYGRKLLQKTLNNPQVHRYLPGPHETVWHAQAVQGTQEIILCESLIDAMTFWVNGFQHSLASYGVNGFTEAHQALLLAHGIQRVLIAYDGDEAGHQAALALAKQLQPLGMACFRLHFPKGMDANEYAMKVQPAPKSLALVISKAQYLGEGPAPVLTSLQDQAVVWDTLDLQVSQQVTKEAEALPITAAKKKGDTVPSSIPLSQESAPAASSLAAKEQSPSAPASTEQENRVASPHDGQVEVSEREITVHYGPRHYRVRGLAHNHSETQLKINLLARNDQSCFVDYFDFYSAKHRYFFMKQTALELGLEESVVKQDLARLLGTLERLQEQQIESTLQPDEPVMSEEEERDALAFLTDPELLSQLLADFAACGVVGEETNKLTGYLAAVSRLLNKPLAILVQSTSAAGKSSLMEAVLSFIPEEQRVQYSAMTGQSLFYMGERDLKHKILAIAEEEGIHQAAYSLKLLQSEGRITMASTGKDPHTGQLKTQDYTVEGPVMLFFTTTAIDIDEELQNRCITLSVNESREQTRLIHDQQRRQRTLAGLQEKAVKQRIRQRHHHVQRLLRPLAILNPYAERLTFLADQTRTRRDHEKYLTLIDSLALLHQYQRPVQTTEAAGQTVEYIEVTLADIALANQLAHEVLGRSLDELPPQTRRLLNLIHQMVRRDCQQQAVAQSDYRFSRKQIRAYTGWGNTQLKVHCQRLEELEYLLVHPIRGRTRQYELLYDGEQGDGKTLYGLIDVETLNQAETKTANVQRSGLNDVGSAPNERKSGLSRGIVGPMSASSRPPKNGQDALQDVLCQESKELAAANCTIKENHGRP